MEKKRLKILFDFDSSCKAKRLRYVLDFLQNHPLSNGNISFVTEGIATMTIVYQKTKESGYTGFFIPAQDCFFNQEPIDTAAFKANTYTFENLSVFSIESEQRTKEPLLKDSSFSFDIFETIFFHISRYEEWYCLDAQKDIWDMMQSQEQFLVKHQLHRRPVVDVLVYAFFKALGLSIDRSTTEYCLSHDIDEVQKFKNPWRLLRSSGGLFLRGQSLQSQRRLWQSYFKTPDPFDNFDWLLREVGDVKKNIYFLVGGKHIYDTPYDLENPRMKTVFEMCLSRGYAVGLHPSYEAWQDEELFRSEKEKLARLLGKPIAHSRQHYLHFDFKRTPLLLEQNNIREDSSMGFNDRIGFRCGTGFSYHLYDFKNERTFSFLENPLVLMDSALFAEGQHDPDKIQVLWNAFLEENKYLTRITFNFHNSRFFDAWIHDIPLKEMYEKIFP